MSLFSIEQLVRPISSDELFEKALDMLEAIDIPARSWRRGSVARSILAVGCELGAQGAAIVTSCVRGGFLLFGADAYLTAHAKDVYDVDRIEATFASGIVKLTNEGGATHTVGADECIVRASSTKARFRITEAFVLAGNSSITVAVSAIEPGSASTVAPGEIDEFETTLARTTVTNETGLVGQDAETDIALVARCLAKKGTWSPFGPRDAYEYAALTATMPDGSPAGITRVAVSRFSSTGQVRVVCATPSGTPTSEQLDAVRENIEKLARNSTATVTVLGAVPKATSHEVTLWARGGTESIIEEKAQAALAALISTYPIGGIAKSEGGQGYLYADAIEAALIGSSEEAFDVDDVGADIALDDDEVATNTTTITVRIR